MHLLPTSKSAALDTPAANSDANDVKGTLIENVVCLPEHCYHAFDALYCALLNAKPIRPTFPDDE